MGWRETKDLGKAAFADERYNESLSHYITAIDQLLAEGEQDRVPNGSNHHINEHQILLSNVIACRLKIGGVDMAEKAVEEAKKVSTIS